MSKRLQVVLDDADWVHVQRAAKSAGLTTSEWVRRTLRRAEPGIAGGDPETKLAAIRLAADHRFPTADIEQMLHEIEGAINGDGNESSSSTSATKS